MVTSVMFMLVLGCPLAFAAKGGPPTPVLSVADGTHEGPAEPFDDSLLLVDMEEETMEVDTVMPGTGGLMYTTTKIVHMMYIEVSDAAGHFRGHYDLYLPHSQNVVSVPQDGRCFWSSIAAHAHPGSAWAVPRLANGVARSASGSVDIDRNAAEIQAARDVMEPFLVLASAESPAEACLESALHS